jgi:hypothetical protein
VFLKAVSLSYYCTEGSCSGIREAIRPYDKTEETCPRLGVRGAHLEDVRGVLDRDGLLDDARLGGGLAPVVQMLSNKTLSNTCCGSTHGQNSSTSATVWQPPASSLPGFLHIV